MKHIYLLDDTFSYSISQVMITARKTGKLPFYDGQRVYIGEYILHMKNESYAKLSVHKAAAIILY